MKESKRVYYRGLIYLAAVFAVVFLFLFVSDRLLSRNNMSIDYKDGMSTIVMRYEKSPVEQLITAEDARRVAQTSFGFESGSFTQADFPLIDDMVSTEQYNENTVEILVIGDSFTYGEASLNRNELYWRRLEILLRTAGYNCRVRAVAMAGATAYEELSWYENYLKENTPDIVIFGYVYNDALINGSDYGYQQKVSWEEQLPYLNPLAKLFPNIYSKLISYIDAKTMYNQKYGDSYSGSNISVLSGDVRDYYQEYFADKLSEITTETGIPSVVITLPDTPNNITQKELFKPLSNIYKNTAVACYNLMPDYNKEFFFSINNDDIHVNPENNHPGSASHEFYAESLFNILSSDFRNIIGEKSTKSVSSSIININDTTPYFIKLQNKSQSETQAEYSFEYPDINETHSFYSMDITPYPLAYPLGKDYIKLCFENPVDLSEIEVISDNCDSLEFYYSKINSSKGYDDNTLKQLFESDSIYKFKSEGKQVTSLCIHAEFSEGANRTITIRIKGK